VGRIGNYLRRVPKRPSGPYVFGFADCLAVLALVRLPGSRLHGQIPGIMKSVFPDDDPFVGTDAR